MSWCHCHTSVNFPWSQPMVPWTERQHTRMLLPMYTYILSDLLVLPPNSIQFLLFLLFSILLTPFSTILLFISVSSYGENLQILSPSGSITKILWKLRPTKCTVIGINSGLNWESIYKIQGMRKNPVQRSTSEYSFRCDHYSYPLKTGDRRVRVNHSRRRTFLTTRVQPLFLILYFFIIINLKMFLIKKTKYVTYSS